MDEAKKLTYISCPSCQTLFRPKITKTTQVNDTYTCIFCNYNFSCSDNISKPLKYQAKISKSTATSKTTQPTATTDYIKLYKFKSKMLLLLWFLIPLFFLDLTVSAIIQNKDHLAQDSRLRGYMQTFCQAFNCKLPTYKNLNHIIIEDNAIVSSETQKNTIQVHAMLNNTSDFDQKFPTISISFTDINGKLVTKKIVKPPQYLKSSSLDHYRLLEKNSKQYISVLIDDPGQTAVNYEIDLVG